MYQSVLFVNVLSKDLSHLNIKVIITTSTILLEIIAKHLNFLYVSNLSAYDETDDEILDLSYLMGVSNTLRKLQKVEYVLDPSYLMGASNLIVCIEHRVIVLDPSYLMGVSNLHTRK